MWVNVDKSYLYYKRLAAPIAHGMVGGFLMSSFDNVMQVVYRIMHLTTLTWLIGKDGHFGIGALVVA